MRRAPVQAPDDDDLDREYRTFSPWLKRQLTGRFELASRDAEDIVQESFLRLSKYSVADRSRHPRALLMRIASNLTLDAHRRDSARGKGNHVHIDDVDPASAPGLLYPADQEALISLKRAILGLPDHLRETFLLARFTPMTNAEIAARLGISTKTVEWRIKKSVSICLAQFEH